MQKSTATPSPAMLRGRPLRCRMRLDAGVYSSKKRLDARCAVGTKPEWLLKIQNCECQCEHRRTTSSFNTHLAISTLFKAHLPLSTSWGLQTQHQCHVVEASAAVVRCTGFQMTPTCRGGRPALVAEQRQDSIRQPLLILRLSSIPISRVPAVAKMKMGYTHCR